MVDRGLARRVDAAEWQRVVAGMGLAFRERRFEDGLMQAIEHVDGLLAEHFALAPGQANPNELPDSPHIR